MPRGTPSSIRGEVIDTSMEGQGRVVAKCDSAEDAHKVCAALNFIEGYDYRSPIYQSNPYARE